MKVLVTGGAGFIGSHLCERLVHDGHSVRALDDLSTGSRSNIARIAQRFELVVGDATDAELVAELGADCDAIVHLAAAVGVKLIVERPAHAITTNTRATDAVLRAAQRRKTPVLIASSSEVYGKSARVPFREDDDMVFGSTTHARWGYACAKALDELLALAFQNEHGVPVVICRFFNVVGPRQSARYGMVLPRFAEQALAGEPLTVYGDGTQTRCFSHVHDAVEASVRLLARLVSLGTAGGGVFNVGSEHEIAIGRLAELVRDAAHSRSSIVHVPFEDAYGKNFEDMTRRVPDCSRLQSTVGFKPCTPLSDCIRDVLAARRAMLPDVGAGPLRA
jgi:UDP-glucose 4-epimerase